jgi:hypothetical protein
MNHPLAPGYAVPTANINANAGASFDPDPWTSRTAELAREFPFEALNSFDLYQSATLLLRLDCSPEYCYRENGRHAVL